MAKLSRQQLCGSFMLEGQKPTIDMLVKQVILRTFDQLKTNAEIESKCKYRPEGCTILDISVEKELIEHFTAYRGPHIDSTNDCNAPYCNCSHAETRAIIRYLKQLRINKLRGRTILITASKFWPCDSCMRIILDSEIIDLIICETAYIPQYIPHLFKQQIESDTDNKLIRNWLKE